MLGLEPSPDAWASLGSRAALADTRIGNTEPLFPRIDQTVEELRQMAADQQEPTPTAPLPATAAPVQPAADASAAGTDRISIDDFMKIELRVAKVLAAERVPNSRKLIKLQVDVGTEHRTLVAGIADAYEPEALVGRSVVIVFNLKPAKLMGIESNGMVLAASADGGKPIIVGFDEPVAPGTRVR
jgi:methionyl-tRNA synthetase